MTLCLSNHFWPLILPTSSSVPTLTHCEDENAGSSTSSSSYCLPTTWDDWYACGSCSVPACTSIDKVIPTYNGSINDKRTPVMKNKKETRKNAPVQVHDDVSCNHHRSSARPTPRKYASSDDFTTMSTTTTTATHSTLIPIPSGLFSSSMFGEDSDLVVVTRARPLTVERNNRQHDDDDDNNDDNDTAPTAIMAAHSFDPWDIDDEKTTTAQDQEDENDDDASVNQSIRVIRLVHSSSSSSPTVILSIPTTPMSATTTTTTSCCHHLKKAKHLSESASEETDPVVEPSMSSLSSWMSYTWSGTYFMSYITSSLADDYDDNDSVNKDNAEHEELQQPQEDVWEPRKVSTGTFQRPEEEAKEEECIFHYQKPYETSPESRIDAFKMARHDHSHSEQYQLLFCHDVESNPFRLDYFLLPSLADES